ncbi:mpv17-like protein isoform X2 [Nerophis ophidion]|uniref:mpv17-like protein isoform X2 n=1 Tax=Nerophis ophidion TaxID=159077 RepID=UPI002AE09479|nr:mpv17-like protein isoform X2 [Nerophis ophidion]
MNRVWSAFRARPYLGNVAGYTALFASADVFQQSVLGRRGSPGVDWRQTARVAAVGFCFHANFNYQWLRWLERRLPGGGAKAVVGKVVVDQLVAAPLTISAFYIGLSLLEDKEDIFEDWRQKFWTSYKAINFSVVPGVARTVFLGGGSLLFTIYLCHLRQHQHQDLQVQNK